MSKKLYYNRAQQEIMFTGAHTNVIIAGRRFGKSHGVMAPSTLRDVQAMPRSAGAFVGATFQQLLTRTLPGTFQALEQMGYKRDIHYYIGKKPPKSAGFKKPYIEPARYDNVISWYNGSIQHLISQDVPGSSNSLTLDYVKIDEGKFVNFDKLKEETFPANGGFRGHFGHIPWHHGVLIISDMPTSKRGSWMLDYIDKSDPELIKTIQSIVVAIYKFKQKKPSIYNQRKIKELTKSLNQLRSIAVYYKEFSSIENLLVLGKAYIQQMKRDLPPLVFQTSILSLRVTKLDNGFYPALNEKIHYYDKFDNSYLQSLEYKLNKAQKESCLQDGDIDSAQPLSIAFDYNANINWLVVGQKQENKMLTLKSFYVKNHRKLKELCNDFADYYVYHPTKRINFYYDSTAINTNYAVDDEDFSEIIANTLTKRGWVINRVYIGKQMRHDQKHIKIDQALKGQKYLFPLFNKHNNEELLIAMEQTGVRVGRNGFEKDKSGEKLAETEEDKLEYRTDGTDAWDTLFIGMNLFDNTNIAYTGTTTFIN